METGALPKKATQEELRICEKFPLKPDLLKGIKNYGCLDPFAANESILLPILEGKDVYAESETCLGKLLAIVIAALQLIKTSEKNCQVILLMSRRELCIQAFELAKQTGKYMKDLNVLAIHGGNVLLNDKKKLEEGPSILISTPGRLLIAIEREFIELRWLKLLILDEADELLGRGFQDKLFRILKFVPSDVQAVMISEARPIEVQNLIDLCLRNPVYVKKEYVYMDMKDTTHYKVSVAKEEDKVAFLRDFYHKIGKKPSIIFCKRVEDLEKLMETLKQENFSVGKMDDSMSIEDRLKAALGFFRNEEQILITVDYVFFDEMKCSQSTVKTLFERFKYEDRQRSL